MGKYGKFGILGSRRFISALVPSIVMAIVFYVPGLVDHSDSIGQILVILFGLLIGGYSAEDYANVRYGNNVTDVFLVGGDDQNEEYTAPAEPQG